VVTGWTWALMMVAQVAGTADGGPLPDAAGLEFPGPAVALPVPPAAGLPFPVVTATLRNGLKVVVAPRAGSGVVAHQVVVRVGSRHEVETGRAGLAHVVAHLVARGAGRTSGGHVGHVLGRWGATSRVATGEDATVFSALGPAEGIHAYVAMEAERLRGAAWGPSTLAAEAAAVGVEVARRQDSPAARLHDTLLAAAFSRHTYGHPVLGLAQDQENLARGYDSAVGFYRKYYVPENVVVVVAGEVDAATVTALVERAYGDWTGQAPVPRPLREPSRPGERRVVVAWHGPTRPRVLLGWLVPEASARTVREVAAARVLGTLLAGEGTPLREQLVRERRVCSVLWAGAGEYRDPHLFVVGAVTREAPGLGEVESLVERALATVASEGVERVLLQAAKEGERWRFLASLERDEAVADHLAAAVSLTGDPSWLALRLDALAKVTSEDVAGFVRRHLVPANRSVVTLVVSRPASLTGEE
jgi:zinc protease